MIHVTKVIKINAWIKSTNVHCILAKGYLAWLWKPIPLGSLQKKRHLPAVFWCISRWFQPSINAIHGGQPTPAMHTSARIYWRCFMDAGITDVGQISAASRTAGGTAESTSRQFFVVFPDDLQKLKNGI